MRKSAYTINLRRNRSKQSMREARQRAPPWEKAEREVSNMAENRKEAAGRLRQLANENYEPGSIAVDLKYRKKEQPTGEEVNSIVKFSRLLILNRVKAESTEVKKQLKITAVLIAISTAVTLAAILAAVCYLK